MMITHLVFSYSSNKYRIYGTYAFLFNWWQTFTLLNSDETYVHNQRERTHYPHQTDAKHQNYTKLCIKQASSVENNNSLTSYCSMRTLGHHTWE